MPTLRGLPWWGAIVLAVGLTTIGAFVDAKLNGGLGSIFKFFYLVGCVAAALAVRRRALFTAAAQPPLIAFAVAMIALFTTHSETASVGLKNFILEVLLPIADLFPWLALTFVITLGLVLGRWYLTREDNTADVGESEAPARARRARTSDDSSRAPRHSDSATRRARSSSSTDTKAPRTSKGAATTSTGTKSTAAKASASDATSARTVQSRSGQTATTTPGTKAGQAKAGPVKAGQTAGAASRAQSAKAATRASGTAAAAPVRRKAPAAAAAAAEKTADDAD